MQDQKPEVISIENCEYTLGKYNVRGRLAIAAASVEVTTVAREDPSVVVDILISALHDRGTDIQPEDSAYIMRKLLERKDSPAVTSKVLMATADALTVFYSLKKWMVDGKTQLLDVEYFYDHFDSTHLDLLSPIASKLNRPSEAVQNFSSTPPANSSAGTAAESSTETTAKNGENQQ